MEVAVPSDLMATVELNVQLPHGQLLIPDFTVVRRTDFHGVLFPVEDVVLVGEVVSPTGRAQDKVLKRDLYAKPVSRTTCSWIRRRSRCVRSCSRSTGTPTARRW
jgi:hypothetical protein